MKYVKNKQKSRVSFKRLLALFGGIDCRNLLKMVDWQKFIVTPLWGCLYYAITC